MPEPVSTFAGRVGRRLKALREHAGLTQEQLAGAAGVARTTVQNTESGRNLVSLLYAVQLCNVLGCGVQSLLDQPRPPAENHARPAAPDPLARIRVLAQEYADARREAVLLLPDAPHPLSGERGSILPYYVLKSQATAAERGAPHERFEPTTRGVP